MLRVERQGDVVLWTMNRPEAKNAIGRETWSALSAAVGEAERDKHLRCAILTGSSRVFSAGADLREARDRVGEDDAERFSDEGEALLRRIEALPIPVIAALPGPAFGGGAELALACDVRIADPCARIAFKHTRMGVSPAWGTIARLVSIVGHGTASRLLFTAHALGAMEARVLRLVDHVTEADGECTLLALAWASDIALGSPSAVARMKALLVESRRATYDAVRPLERAAFVESWTGEDHREAVAAYFERRTPTWQTRS